MSNPTYELIPQGQATPTEWALLKVIHAEALALVKIKMASWRNEITPLHFWGVVSKLDLTGVRLGWLANQVELNSNSHELDPYASQASHYLDEFQANIYKFALITAQKESN
jgi:hypothetical protein